jgi:putative endonuclease
MHYVYILQSIKDRTLYKGTTSDLKRRLKEHNSGKGFYTSQHYPYKLIYYEAYMLKIDAEAREKYLKTSMGMRVIRKQLANYLISTGTKQTKSV